MYFLSSTLDSSALTIHEGSVCGFPKQNYFQLDESFTLYVANIIRDASRMVNYGKDRKRMVIGDSVNNGENFKEASCFRILKGLGQEMNFFECL